MSIFKKSNNNISKTVKAQTVIVNGKVVSDNDPEVKAVMDDMQRGFSEIFSEGNIINADSNSDDIAKFVESTLRLAGISNTVEVTGAEISSPSFESQTRVFECKNCGARNTIIPGADAVCEYCGSGLK